MFRKYFLGLRIYMYISRKARLGYVEVDCHTIDCTGQFPSFFLVFHIGLAMLLTNPVLVQFLVVFFSSYTKVG